MAEPLRLPTLKPGDDKVPFVGIEHGLADALIDADPPLGKWAVLAYLKAREYSSSAKPFGLDGRYSQDDMNIIFKRLGCEKNRRSEALHQLERAGFFKPNDQDGFDDTRYCIVPTNRAARRAEVMRSPHARRQAAYRVRLLLKQADAELEKAGG